MLHDSVIFFHIFDEFPMPSSTWAPPPFGVRLFVSGRHATALLRLRVGRAGHGVAMAPQPPEDGVLLHLDDRLGVRGRVSVSVEQRVIG